MIPSKLQEPTFKAVNELKETYRSRNFFDASWNTRALSATAGGTVLVPWTLANFSAAERARERPLEPDPAAESAVDNKGKQLAYVLCLLQKESLTL